MTHILVDEVSLLRGACTHDAAKRGGNGTPNSSSRKFLFVLLKWTNLKFGARVFDPRRQCFLRIHPWCVPGSAKPRTKD